MTEESSPRHDSWLIRGIGELATCDPALPGAGILRHAAVHATDGVVDWVGLEADLPAAITAAPGLAIDAAGATLVPGFVDCHTHLVFGGGRAGEFDARHSGQTYEQLAAAGGGIRSTVAATSAAGDDDLLHAAAGRARAALESGTTTLEVKTGYGLTPAAELRLLDLIGQLAVDASVVPTLLALHALPAGSEAAAYLDTVVDVLLPAAAGRARFCDVFCDRAAFAVADCERVLMAAVGRGMVPKVHAEQLSASGGAELAARVGAASADHLEYLDQPTAIRLAAARVVGVLLPGATLSLRAPAPDARMMLDAGMTLALATDCNPGTSNTTDMRLVIALAVGLMGLSPAEALVAATRGSASALRLRDRGILGVGMRMDAALLEADSHVDLSYRLGAVPVRSAWVAGRLVVGQAV
ncbi:MAG: imidazolonepropionase [Candidatus Dormibacteria bacterium]